MHCFIYKKSKVTHEKINWKVFTLAKTINHVRQFLFPHHFSQDYGMLFYRRTNQKITSEDLKLMMKIMIAFSRVWMKWKILNINEEEKHLKRILALGVINIDFISRYHDALHLQNHKGIIRETVQWQINHLQDFCYTK